MRESYGEVILKKDFILYHTSDNVFKNKPKHLMLFCTFHPSEWFYGEDFITTIKLKKDVSLFFMIDFDYSITLSSYLPIFTNLSIHLHKINHTNSQLLFYHNELKNNNFDGWFNSNVIDKTYLEVALLNDSDSFEVVKTERLKKDWSRENNANNIVTLKKWGVKYPMFSLNIPVIFKLNKRYEKSIKKYIKTSINNKFYPKCCFQILLQNAFIKYHKGEFKNIVWNV